MTTSSDLAERDEGPVDDLGQLWARMSRELLLGIRTAVPGVIVSYDSAARRATVQPAVQLLMTDGTLRKRAQLANVPVLHPSAGGFTMLFPVRVGDPVMLLFTERGMTAFKRTLAEGPPDRAAPLGGSDGVALVGFGPASVTPADTEAVTLQTDDGSAYIALRSDRIDLVAPEVRVNGTAIG